MPIIKIQNDSVTASINSQGAELISLKNREGREFIWQKDPAVWNGQSPVLFPIVSSLKQHGPNRYILDGKEYEMGLHGFAKLMEFEVEQQTGDSVTFLLRANDFTRAQYPFEFEFRVSFRVEQDGISIDYVTDNVGTKNLYYSTGSHEALALEGGVENYSIVFDREETLAGYLIQPSGELVMTPLSDRATGREFRLCEDFFSVDAIIFLDVNSRGVALRDDRTGRQTHLSFPDCETLLLWKIPGADYVCIEAWAGAPEVSWKPYEDFSQKYRIRTLVAGARETISHSFHLEGNMMEVSM